MSCMSVIIRRIGEAVSSIKRVDAMSFSFARRGMLSVRFSRCGEMSATVTRSGGMDFIFGLVCGTNLDQREGIIWASDGRLITLEGGFLIPNGR